MKLFYYLVYLPLFAGYCFIILIVAATKIYVIHKKSRLIELMLR